MLNPSSRTKQCFSRYAHSFSNGRCRDETPEVEWLWEYLVCFQTTSMSTHSTSSRYAEIDYDEAEQRNHDIKDELVKIIIANRLCRAGQV